MNRYFLVIEEDVEKKSIMNVKELQEFAIPFAALLNEHRNLEDRVDVTDIDNLLEGMSRLVFVHIIEIEEIKKMTIMWLVNNQRLGAFDGHIEEHLDFEKSSVDEIEWYFTNWVIDDEHFVDSLLEEYQLA